MESYLTEIKQLRIPRPKFEPNGGSPSGSGWRRFVTRPYTPPRDYNQAAGGDVAPRQLRQMQEAAKDYHPAGMRTTPLQHNEM